MKLACTCALGLLLFPSSALWAQSPAQAPPAATSQTPALPQKPAATPPTALNVVVLDAAHGGTDPGARGPGGAIEKDIVLNLAKALRSDLASHGWQVVLTREGNDNPSFDDRAMVANAQRGAVFITLHVASTGRAGTAHAYFLAALGNITANAKSAAEKPGLVRWEEAQASYAAHSRQLAELLQVQFGQKFRGSPEVPTAAPVRQLRNITAPAIAVELSSIASDPKTLEGAVPDLAAALRRALEAFRSLYEAGGN